MALVHSGAAGPEVSLGPWSPVQKPSSVYDSLLINQEIKEQKRKRRTFLTHLALAAEAGPAHVRGADDAHERSRCRYFTLG